LGFIERISIAKIRVTGVVKNLGGIRHCRGFRHHVTGADSHRIHVAGLVLAPVVVPLREDYGQLLAEKGRRIILPAAARPNRVLTVVLEWAGRIAVALGAARPAVGVPLKNRMTGRAVDAVHAAIKTHRHTLADARTGGIQEHRAVFVVPRPFDWIGELVGAAVDGIDLVFLDAEQAQNQLDQCVPGEAALARSKVDGFVVPEKPLIDQGKQMELLRSGIGLV
jgi:hypothetical protein